ncbi:MAG: hypothetical protein JWM11_5289 [Planctomycetaceae bacterium]|nr:hypothetical protein [Planctomycetaceae bacterium]
MKYHVVLSLALILGICCSCSKPTMEAPKTEVLKIEPLKVEPLKTETAKSPMPPAEAPMPPATKSEAPKPRQPKPETLADGGYDQQEMDEAIARARREVDEFIVELSKKNGKLFSVKAPVAEKDQVEHFWLTDLVYQDGVFSGKIGNDPGIVSNVKIGQPWTVKKADISDWMFMRGGKIHGNYTMRPLLKTLPKEKADAFRSMLANP